MRGPHCYFFIALPCEAKPLINYFKLKKELSLTAFSLYRNADITLTVTGVGKSAMAAGVAYTLALFPTAYPPVMLNIGIAGHCDQPLGTLFVIDKIRDQDTGRQYYPQLVATPPCLTQLLTTVSKVSSDYPEDSLYDMEATAFYETATRFSSSELIHCVKIISDNQDNHSTEIKPAQVSEWIIEKLPLIQQYKQQLNQLVVSDSPAHIQHYEKIISQWRFTNQEKIQLKSLLNKLNILMVTTPLDLISLSEAPSGKVVLNHLRNILDAQAFGHF